MKTCTWKTAKYSEAYRIGLWNWRTPQDNFFLETLLQQYTKSVELFTQRSLSFPENNIPACSAIETLLSEDMDSGFRAGLPTAYFDFALPWMPMTLLYKTNEYPSWSWCGWNEPIEYSFSTLEGVHTTFYSLTLMRMVCLRD